MRRFDIHLVDANDSGNISIQAGPGNISQSEIVFCLMKVMLQIVNGQGTRQTTVPGMLTPELKRIPGSRIG